MFSLSHGSLLCLRGTHTHTHTHTHTQTNQRLVAPVGIFLVTAASQTTSAGVGFNAGAVRRRNGLRLQNIPTTSFGFGFIPEIKLDGGGEGGGEVDKEKNMEAESSRKGGGLPGSPKSMNLFLGIETKSRKGVN